MEKKFTEGEWIIDDIDILSESGMAICQVYDASDSHISDMDMDVVNANAKLIAAAPELLEACIKSLEHHQGAHSEIGFKLREAIKKATV